MYVKYITGTCILNSFKMSYCVQALSIILEMCPHTFQNLNDRVITLAKIDQSKFLLHRQRGYGWVPTIGGDSGEDVAAPAGGAAGCAGCGGRV